MAVDVILGGLGSGKTTTLTWMGHIRFDEGCSLYCNYKLYDIEYYSLENIFDFKDITTEKNFIMLDELWLTSDSRRCNSLLNIQMSKRILQSRKTHSDVCISSQDFFQLDPRIRNITRYLFEPEIIQHDENGKPIFINLTIYDWQHKSNKKISIIIPMQMNFKHGYVDVPESFETDEILETMTNPTEKEYKNLIKKYISFDGKKSDLESVLQIKEGMGASESKTLSKYILVVKNGLV